MKIYKFENFKSVDLTTVKYINGNINESEYLEYLNKVNESFIGDVKSKVLKILYTFIENSKKLGFKIMSKIKTFFNWFFKSLKSWREKNPTLSKVIIITVVSCILLIVSASTAHAAMSGNPIPIEQINLAIGWLEQLRELSDIDILEINKAIAHLIDLKDGNIDIHNLGDGAIKIANASINTAGKMIQQASEDLDKGDESLAKSCFDLIERGSSYVDAVYKKIGEDQEIRLVMK
jgi:hypothetical protein